MCITASDVGVTRNMPICIAKRSDAPARSRAQQDESYLKPRDVTPMAPTGSNERRTSVHHGPECLSDACFATSPAQEPVNTEDFRRCVLCFCAVRRREPVFVKGMHICPGIEK